LDTEAAIARKVRDSQIENRTARSRLAGRRKPYYRLMQEGLHIGYRKPKSGGAGRWIVRVYKGNEDYEVQALEGFADDYADADGVQILNFGQAQERARKIAGRPAASSKMETAADALAYYLKAKPSADAENRIKALIEPKLGSTKITNLSTEKIRDWHHGLAKQAPRLRTRKDERQKFRKIDGDEDLRRRQASANRTLTTLKAALNFCFDEGLLSSNEAWRRVKPFKGVEVGRVRYLQKEEVRRLVNAADEELRPLVQAALLTGCRYGELCRLTKADYNRDAGTVAIRKSKTAKPRQVILNAEGKKFFDTISAGREASEMLLVRNNGRPWSKSHVARPMRVACANARIKPPISVHGLRHTYASLAVMNGTELFVLARNLGHRDVRMIEKHYGHLSDSYLTAAIRENVPALGIVGKTKLQHLR